MLTIRKNYDDVLSPFESTLNALWHAAPRWEHFAPAADVTEGKEGYEISLDVPGMTEKDVEVTVEHRQLTLRGARKESEANYTRRERFFGTFERAFELPDDVDVTRIEAAAKNGVLTVKLPRAEAAKPKTIAVKAE